MRMAGVLLLVCCLLSLGTAQTFGFAPERPRGQTYVLEGLGGVAGLGVGAALGLGAAFGVASLCARDFPSAYYSAVMTGIACATALPACAGYGVNSMGEYAEAGGSSKGAYIGSYIALLVAVGLVALGHASRTTAGIVAGWALGALAIPTGAAVGYNWPSGRSAGIYGTRIDGSIGIPVVALDRVVRDDRTAEYGVRVQLASVRLWSADINVDRLVSES